MNLSRLTVAAVAALPNSPSLSRLPAVDEQSLISRSGSAVSSTFSNLTASTSLSNFSVARILKTSGFGSSTPKRKYTFKNRVNSGARESDDRDKKRKKFMTPESITDVLSADCCTNECLKKMTYTSVEMMRNRYIPLVAAEKNNAVLQTIRLAIIKHGLECRFLTFGVEACSDEVCYTALQHLYGIGHSTLTKLVAHARNYKISSLTLPSTIQRQNCWIPIVRNYVHLYAERFGSPMPNSNTTELPVGTKRQVYLRFRVHVEGLQDIQKQACTESWFYRVWKQECPNITVPKRCKFSKCDACAEFKALLTDCRSNFEQRKAVVVEFDKHLTAQMLERNLYYQKRDHARNYPDECMSLICDGMQQHTTQLPCFRYGSKKLWASTKLQAHVVGVLDHGSQPQVYIHDPTVGGGPNLIMQCVWNAMQHTLKTRGKLPPLLYLQLDNTSGENKNHWVFEFAALLVENGYFEEVCYKYFFGAYYIQPLLCCLNIIYYTFWSFVFLSKLYSTLLLLLNIICYFFLF